MESDEERSESTISADGASQETNSNWYYLPDSILLHIFQYLTARELLDIGLTCRSWLRVSYDEFLWKDLKNVLAGRVQTPLLSHACSSNRSVEGTFTSGFTRQFCSQWEDVRNLLKRWLCSAGFKLQCRVMNKPYDIFGTWFSDRHLLSGDLHWLAHLVSTSILWLNKASQESESELVPIMDQLYRFYNCNASSIRAVMVANCLAPSPPECEGSSSDAGDLSDKGNASCERGNPPSHRDINSPSTSDYAVPSSSMEPEGAVGEEPPEVLHPVSSRLQLVKFYNDIEIDDIDEVSSGISDASVETEECASESDDLSEHSEKYLIFTTGSKTYTPHQIGFKRIKSVNFPRKLDPGPSLRERLAEREREREREKQNAGVPRPEPNWYLYVNSRPWPRGYVIRNPLDPPPIAQEIDIHVIDLVTLKEFPHVDVVNSVAFNPRDPEMLVTTSDDYTVKVWRSRNKVKLLGLEDKNLPRGLEVRRKSRCKSRSSIPSESTQQ
ncbi:hypothetical protein C0J52_13251 [Blattella germanica]|nr:hypothetical protein C0J52_13251 [Blattella germanica]